MDGSQIGIWQKEGRKATHTRASKLAKWTNVASSNGSPPIERGEFNVVIFYKHKTERGTLTHAHVIDSRKETPFRKVANIGSIYCTLRERESEHIGRTTDPPFFSPSQLLFLPPRALSLTFITSILAPAWPSQERGSRILSVKLMSTIYLT